MPNAFTVHDHGDRTYSLIGLTYAELKHLREISGAACEQHQAAMADSGGMPNNGEEAEVVAFMQRLYLETKRATR